MKSAGFTSVSVWLALCLAGCGDKGSDTDNNALAASGDSSMSSNPTAPSQSGTPVVTTPTSPGGTVPSVTPTNPVTTPSAGATDGGPGPVVPTNTGTGATPGTGGAGPGPVVPTTPEGTDSVPVTPPSAGTTDPGPAAGGAGGDEPMGTGGTGTVPVVPAEPEPTLVTSADNDWWKVGEVTEGGTTATVTVNDTMKLQHWDGFGGTFNEKGWDALAVLTEAERGEVIKKLFDKNDGTAFSYGRIPIGASDYASSRYSLNETAGDYEMANFSIEHDRAKLIPFIKAAQAVNPALKFWGSPWAPPTWMMEINTAEMYPSDAGKMKTDDMTLQAHALYLARFVEEYALEDIDLFAVLPQNEAGWSQHYPSCMWDRTGAENLMAKYIGQFLGPTFAERDLATEIWVGTLSNNSNTQQGQVTDNTLAKAVLADATAKPFVKGAGLQWEFVEAATEFTGKDIPVWQTEHKCGNYPWEHQTTEYPDGATFGPAPNDFAYGEESWGLLVQWLETGVNGYMAWNMVLDIDGMSLDEVRPWAQNALITVDTAQKKVNYTPTYYIFRHISQYVEPGATRVGLSGGDGVAFQNPDGSIVTVLHNEGAQASETTLSVGGKMLQFTIPGKGWATINWQG